MGAFGMIFVIWAAEIVSVGVRTTTPPPLSLISTPEDGNPNKPATAFCAVVTPLVICEVDVNPLIETLILAVSGWILRSTADAWMEEIPMMFGDSSESLFERVLRCFLIYWPNCPRFLLSGYTISTNTLLSTNLSSTRFLGTPVMWTVVSWTLFCTSSVQTQHSI